MGLQRADARIEEGLVFRAAVPPASRQVARDDQVAEAAFGMHVPAEGQVAMGVFAGIPPATRVEARRAPRESICR